MGSWHGTDGLTQLAIRERDKVKLFILLPRKGYRGEEIGAGVSYPDDFFAPIGAPLSGRLNMYGSLESIEDDLSSEFMSNWLTKNLAVDQNAGKGTIVLTKGAEPKKGELKNPTLKSLVAWIERGWVRLEDVATRGPLTYMLVLESIYKAVMKTAATLGEDRWTRDGRTYKEAKEEAATAWLESLKGSEDKSEKARDARHEVKEGLWQFEHGNMLLRFWLGGFLERKGLDAATFAAARDMIVDHFVFKNFMERARKAYAPQSGAGMQDDCVELQEALAKATLDVCAKRGRERVARG